MFQSVSLMMTDTAIDRKTYCRFSQFKIGGTKRLTPRAYLLESGIAASRNQPYFHIIISGLTSVLRDTKAFQLTHKLPPNVSYADQGRKIREW